MTNTKTILKLTVFSLFIMLFALCIMISGASAVRAEASAATEATDVYWYVHGGKLLLSSEQGSSGYYKWSKESIASVINAADVPWDSDREDIASVIIYSPIAPPSTAFWFQDTALTSFSATSGGTLYLDMSFTTDASRMFAGCSSLETLDLSGASAPLVTNIESVFDGCSSIKSLDISCFDGAQISNMMNAFYGCSRLEALDVSGLDTSRVTDFAGVFSGCASLKALDLSELDGKKITTLENAFNGCEKLTSLTFGDNFTCENVTDMMNAFKLCKSLKSLDISGFSTSRVTNMYGTFYSCEALEELTLGSGFVCSSVEDMEAMFASCKALVSLDTGAWGATAVKNMRRMFINCTSLEGVDLSGFDGAEPTDISSLFSGASSLRSADLSGLDTSGVTSLYGLFNGCSSLEGVDLSDIDTSAVTRMDSTFKGCTSLTSFSFVGVNTSQVETMGSMFYGCKNLESVDLRGIDSGKVTSIDSMFYECSSLKILDLSDLDIVEGLDTDNVVRSCSHLAQIVAPESIPEAVSISLCFLTFYTGEEEITELASEHGGTTVVRKFDIGYYRKNGTAVTKYTLEPSYYYYGTGAAINAVVSENGYVFGGWTRKDSNVTVTEITATDTGNIGLYAKLTPHQPVAPKLTVSDDATVTYGEGYAVSVDFVRDELHTYTISWYRAFGNGNTAGVELSGIRNTNGFTAAPKSFPHGVEIEKETYFYCTVTATRKDNGLSKAVTSDPIMVYVERAQAEITVHPTAIEGLVYTGSEMAVATLGESSFGNVYYSFDEFEGYTMGNNKQKNAGVGILYYRVGDGLYHKRTQTYTLEYKIEAATPAVVWATEEKTVDYTGEQIAIDPPSVLLLNSDTYTGAVTYSYTGTSSGNGFPVNAGTYSIIATVEAGGNYKAASSAAFTLTVNKTAPEFGEKPSPVSGLIYNGTGQALASRGETTCGTVEFSLDGSSWSSELPKGKNAGEYTVYYRIKGDNNHLDGASGSFVASIGKKSITVTAEDKVICINGSYDLTHSVEGLAQGETLPIALTLGTDANVGAAGTYGITAGGADESDNYTVTYVGGTLTVREHSYDGGAVTASPTCTESGVKTYTCLHDGTHTYTETLPVDANAHTWGEGSVTTSPTCSAKGVKTYVCTHDSEHTYAEDINALGHSYANACDGDCNACGETRVPAEHHSENADGKCDVCGERFKLSGGAVAGIVIGSVAAVGGGGFSLFWFVIRKRRRIAP